MNSLALVVVLLLAISGRATVSASYFEESKDSCLRGTSAPKHSNNVLMRGIHTNPDLVLQGTTYWINDFMAVGHMMYDVGLVELLRTQNIDRIVLQRAPCATSDLCRGRGTYESFFRTFYAAAIAAASANKSTTSLYMRFHANEQSWQPRLLMVNSSAGNEAAVDNRAKAIPVADTVCFARLLRRTCNKCFHNAIGREAALAFKQAAYKIVFFSPPPPSPASTPETPADGLQKRGRNKKVIYAYRGNAHYRELANPSLLLDELKKKLLVNSGAAAAAIDVELFDTSIPNLTSAAQIAAVASSDVVICTHGAFESNIVYMQEGTLLIEIRGLDALYLDEGPNFWALAKLFLVTYEFVIAQGLKGDRDLTYALSSLELDHISNLVGKHLSTTKSDKGERERRRVTSSN